MLNSGKEMSAVLQAMEVGESTTDRWRKHYGGMKSEEAVRLKKLEAENRLLKELLSEWFRQNQCHDGRRHSVAIVQAET
jgi:hypothetical protein